MRPTTFGPAQASFSARCWLGHGVVSMLALVVIVPVVTFYLLLDWDRIVARLDDLLPREHAPAIRGIAGRYRPRAVGFVRGQGLVILILARSIRSGWGWSGCLWRRHRRHGGGAVLHPHVGVIIGGATAIGVALFSFWDQPVWIGAVVLILPSARRSRATICNRRSSAARSGCTRSG